MCFIYSGEMRIVGIEINIIVFRFFYEYLMVVVDKLVK